MFSIKKNTYKLLHLGKVVSDTVHKRIHLQQIQLINYISLT